MLAKLSYAIAAEYEKPHPDRKTALSHFQQIYHCEKRGRLWYVDRSIQKLPTRSTGNPDADAILMEIAANGG